MLSMSMVETGIMFITFDLEYSGQDGIDVSSFMNVRNQVKKLIIVIDAYKNSTPHPFFNIKSGTGLIIISFKICDFGEWIAYTDIQKFPLRKIHHFK